MIAWILTAYTGADATDVVADVAADRRVAIAAGAEALRHAVLDAGQLFRCDIPAPSFVVAVDGEEVATVRLDRTELGKLTVDDALDSIDQFEAGAQSAGPRPNFGRTSTQDRGVDW